MPKIMIVDDGAIIAMQLEEQLASTGYNVVGTACSGKEAVDMARALKPDLILMDIMMPGEMDGIEAARIIKKEQDTPVIFITAYGEDRFIERMKDIEPFGYIMKPFQTREVRGTIEIALYKKDLERRLRESEERFRRLAENSRDMICRMSLPDGCYQFVSPASTEIFGYTPEEFYKTPLLIEKILQRDWQGYFKEQWARLLAGHDAPPCCEYQIVHKSGDIRWVNERDVLICDQFNHPVAIEGIITDVTETKHVEEALWESEKKYRGVVELASDGIAIIQDNRFRYVNPALAAIMGEAVGMMTENIFYSYIYPDDQPMVIGNYKRLMAGIDDTAMYETILIRKDGSNICVELNASIITYQGKQAMLAIFRDITAKKLAEKALRESEARYRAIVEDQTELVCRFTPSRRLTFANGAFCRYFGEGVDNLIGRGFISFICDDERNRAEGLLDSLSVRHPVIAEEIRVEAPEQRIRWHQWTIRAIFDENCDIREFQAVGRDITEQKKAEEELRSAKDLAEVANKTKSQFLACMSHELRTPLTSIVGFSEILLEKGFGPLNDRQEEYTRDIFESGLHLLSLINDLLDLTKIESGNATVRLCTIKIKALLEHCLTMIKEKVMKNNLKVALVISEDAEDLEITGDEVKLKQVILNLLSNATKFTPIGGSIMVDARKEGEELVVTVIDSGIGISRENHETIFEEFYQIQSCLKDKTPGTGLGLALSKRLVEIHGGKIWVESEGAGKGSKFCVSLPLNLNLFSVPSPEVLH